MVKEDDKMVNTVEDDLEKSPMIGDSDTTSTASKEKSRKWMKIGIITCILLVVTAGLVAGIVVAVTQDDHSDETDRLTPFGFDDIFSDDMRVSSYSIRWLPTDGDHTYRENGDIYIRRLPDLDPELVVRQSDVRDPDTGSQLSFFDYWFSYDEQYVLLATDYKKVWRHSYLAKYWIYNVDANVTYPISSDLIQYASFSPSTYDLVYVQGNNIYLFDIVTQDETSITSDGSDAIANGVPAWVYEEEVFGTDNTLWWSPDGKQFSYLKFDESAVETFSMTVYDAGAKEDPLSNDYPSYPRQVNIKYPKVGFENPTAEMWVYSLADEIAHPVSFDFDGDEEEPPLIISVGWISDEMMLVRLANRVQNFSALYSVDSADGYASTLIYETEVENGWIDYFDPKIVNDPNRPEALLFIDRVDYGGYNHLALFDAQDPDNVVHLTSGNWEVKTYNGYHEATSSVFYTSTEDNMAERHIYSVDLSGGNKKRLTTPVGYFSASFSSGASYYLLNYQGPSIPYQLLRSTTDDNFEIVVETNSALNQTLTAYALPSVSYITIPATADSPYELDARVFWPPYFDESKTYPILLHVYGGPDSNYVTKTFRLDWHTYMSSTEEYIIAEVDGRGTGSRGNEFKYSVYRHLGEFETVDQITAGRYFASQPYVDPNRIAIWGWSYGGYMASKVAESGSGVFRACLAVAPVTDWKFYDTVYTERYMALRIAGDNFGGYDKSRVVNVDQFNKTGYFLVHGTADDNVHFQQSAVLSYSLTQANIDFRYHAYTDSDHSINTGSNTQYDLYRRFTDFFKEVLV